MVVPVSFVQIPEKFERTVHRDRVLFIVLEVANE